MPPAAKTFEFEKAEVKRLLRALFSTEEEYEFLLTYISIALTNPYYIGPKMILSNAKSTKATFLREFVCASLGADMFIENAQSSGDNLICYIEESRYDPMYDIEQILIIYDLLCFITILISNIIL